MVKKSEDLNRGSSGWEV